MDKKGTIKLTLSAFKLGILTATLLIVSFFTGVTFASTRCVEPKYTLIEDRFLDLTALITKLYSVKLGESACFDSYLTVRVLAVAKNSTRVSIKLNNKNMGIVSLQGQKRFRAQSYLIKRIIAQGSRKAHLQIVAKETFTPLPIVEDDIVCFELYKPVCAEKDGALKTYSNDCYARKYGAKVVSEGECA